MKKTIRIALAQINPTVGDLKENELKIIDYLKTAKRKQADLVAFPELSITGYPPEDILLKSQFTKDNLQSIHRIVSASQSITTIVGFVDHTKNAAAIIHNGRWTNTYYKIHLPNYGVFDEKRYFTPGSRLYVLELNRIKIGVNICEDIWIPDSVTESQVFQGGAEVIINISSSPFHCGKIEERENMLTSRAKNNRAIICYVNLIGGQDELVFDGNSLIINEKGEILVRGKQFDEDLIFYDLDVTNIDDIRNNDELYNKKKLAFKSPFKIEQLKLSEIPKKNHSKPKLRPQIRPRLDALAEIYRALVLGTHDYILKNGFNKVVLGLSGGIDSALTAVIATDAIGAECVVGVSMPSQYSSPGSLTDAEQLVANLGIKHLIIPIQQTFGAYKSMLSATFKNLPEDITEENIQARIRGNIIMALSNKFGWLPLTTGNKSEISVGYCTLYGDMAGGFAVIKDVPKTMVYKLAHYVNEKKKKEIIPHNIIIKPPSAELRPNQKDEDSLPPYEILDPILNLYIEKDYDLHKIIEAGYDEETVKNIIQLVDSNEYKRRQSPPGVKITPKAFGKDRRMPITNRYRG